METMIICEKPNAAMKIAKALAEKNFKEIKTKYGTKYYYFERNGKKFYAIPAVGHIFTLKDDSGKGWDYPIFKTKWVPSFEAQKKAMFSKKYFKVFEEFADKVNDVIVATDLDEEGSVIGYNILRFILKRRNAKRMCFSTLTKKDLVKAYENLMDHLDFERIEAGLTRHELDFLYGINTSRALTLSVKRFGKVVNYYVLSSGRVQSPMLYFLIKREKEIQSFIPKPFWQIFAILEKSIEAQHVKDKFWDEKEAKNAFEKAKGKKAIVEKLDRKRRKLSPPTPFDLTSLQTEAYRFFGYSPKRTIEIAQSLYTSGYISYPRTSSQKLPPQIGYKNILNVLSKLKNYESACKFLLSKKELKPNEGKKEDPAHPAIYPTAEPPNLNKLSKEERKLYDLIVRRFLAVFGEPAIRESISAKFDIGGEKFIAKGIRTIEKNWMDLYGDYAKFDENVLPELKIGQELNVKKLNLERKETQPPQRYSQGSIVKELEKHGIGTKTTRAMILQILYDRGYIEGKSIKVTKLGMVVGETLAKYVPDLVSEKLTRKFEKEMEKVSAGKIKREEVIKDAEKVLKKICEEFKKNEEKIGIELEKAILYIKDKKNILGSCKCGGILRIIKTKNKKRFVGCSNYPKCNTSFPLPAQGMIESTGQICKECGTPIILVKRKGKRPFRMCLDPKCKTKERWNSK